MYNNDELIAAVLNAGATKAVVIPDEQIVTDRMFFDICATNACGKFGRCWACPPDIGPIDELMARVRDYRQGVLYQTIGSLEDSFDIEGMEEASKYHTQVSQRIQEAMKPILGEGKFFHMSCGGCSLCERCAKLDNEPCRHPDKTLISLEGAGVDVYNTTKDTPLKYINGTNTVTFFGMVLFEEKK